MAKHSPPTFTVKFEGSKIRPDTVPLRSAVDAMSAVYRIAAGISEDEPLSRKPEERIHLVKVRKGSAEYDCRTSVLGAVPRIVEAGKAIRRPARVRDSLLSTMMSPTEVLSSIAKTFDCVILVLDEKKRTIAEFTSETYGRVVKGRLVQGETTLLAKVERVGGVTEQKCTLRVHGRPRLLYCKIDSESVAKLLGTWLYRHVSVSGMATWIGNWRLRRFTIHDAVEYQPKPLSEVIQQLRVAGGDAWDRVTDVDAFLSEKGP